MRGIILAGGAGNRLYPLTEIASKQLQPVYDKPMIYYPLSTLMMIGITEILIISTPRDIKTYKNLLGDGSRWGISLTYAVQQAPKGIADAFIVGESFVGGNSVCLILGDNIFYGPLDFLRNAVNEFKNGATIFGYYVNDPARYGVVEISPNGKAISIEEKPDNPKSNFAVPGLYLFDNKVVEISKRLKTSERGELEITDVNLVYLRSDQLNVIEISRGIAWLDTGTHQSLLDASQFFGTLEARQGLKVACLEEVALRFGYIDTGKMLENIENTPGSSYRDYLKRVYREFKEQE